MSAAQTPAGALIARATAWRRPECSDADYYQYPRERGVVYGQPSSVAAWPASSPDQPDRRPHQAGEEPRALRLSEQSRVYLYVVFASGISRCYANGEEVSEEAFYRAILVTPPSRESDAHFYPRFMADITRAGLSGKSFFSGPCPCRAGSAYDHPWQSGTVDYPLCPAR